MKNIKLNYIVPILLGVAFVVLAWVRLVVQNSDLLFEAQEQSFWQSGPLFRAQLLAQPGGWFTYLGRYLTQFFFYPAVGASLLILLWLVIYVLWLVAFRLKWYLNWVALIVPMLLLWGETSVGYAVYVLKTPDWWFAPTLFVVLISILLAVARPLSVWIRSAWQALVLVAALFIGHQWQQASPDPATLFTPFHASMSDARFHAELRMDRAVEEGRWNDALTEMRAVKEAPTRVMWLLKNVALLHEGRLAESWLDYPCMTGDPAVADSIATPIVLTSGPLIYFHFGSTQFAYRWSVENFVEYGVTNKRLRLMTRCALIKEEWNLAEKYLNMLSRTTFHREWAEQQRKFVRHPELLAQDAYYQQAYQICRARANQLDGDGSLAENYLVKNYSQTALNDCPVLAELSLVFAMQSQDIHSFWIQFSNYVRLHPGQNMPRVIQEAVLLYINLEPQSAPRTNFPFDKQVTETFRSFNERSQQLMQVGYKDEALGKALQHDYGKTFFWFYFFCRNVNTY